MKNKIAEEACRGSGYSRCSPGTPATPEPRGLDSLGRDVTSLLFSSTFQSVPWWDYLDRETRSRAASPSWPAHKPQHQSAFLFFPALRFVTRVACRCRVSLVGVKLRRVAKVTAGKVKLQLYLSVYLQKENSNPWPRCSPSTSAGLGHAKQQPKNRNLGAFEQLCLTAQMPSFAFKRASVASWILAPRWADRCNPCQRACDANLASRW